MTRGYLWIDAAGHRYGAGLSRLPGLTFLSTFTTSDTFAGTLAAQLGATTKELMERLGHSSSRASLIYRVLPPLIGSGKSLTAWRSCSGVTPHHNHPARSVLAR